MMYKEVKIKSEIGYELDFIVKENEDGSSTWIIKDEANSDYQTYLKQLEEGSN
jgi:hypothetical protein